MASIGGGCNSAWVRLLSLPTHFFTSQRDQLVALAARHAIPTIYYFRDFAAIAAVLLRWCIMVARAIGRTDDRKRIKARVRPDATEAPLRTRTVRSASTPLGLCRRSRSEGCSFESSRNRGEMALTLRADFVAKLVAGFRDR
jgi:hypothetical protein